MQANIPDLEPDPQSDLFIDGIPEIVHGYGLRAMHPYPLVSNGKDAADNVYSFRVPRDRAWRFPSLQIPSAGSVYAAIAVDCDHPDRAAAAIMAGKVPAPNWQVQRESNRHIHAVYTLADPVHKYDHARMGPMEFLSGICEYYTEAMQGDPAYTQILTHNPLWEGSGEFKTHWGRKEPYKLQEMAEVIPFGWEAPVVHQNAVGRNVTLFQALMVWAARAENRGRDVLTAAYVVNQRLEPEPLPESEVRSTARSVEKYRARWEANGWHSTRFRQRQSARGRLGGRPRKYEAGKEPWTEAGMSRATWYRKMRQNSQHS